MISQAESGLAEADQRIEEAAHNIRQLGSLVPELAINGYSTTEVEGQIEQMMQALDYLRAQRRTIAESLDGDDPAPRMVQSGAHVRAQSWRAIYMRLGA